LAKQILKKITHKFSPRPNRNFRISIRARFFLVLLLLTILPILAYRFAIDLHQIIIKDQAKIQYQTVVNLSLVLENRTDLWAMQIQSGSPTSQLAHLNLNNSVLWIVNKYGQTSYVVGKLSKEISNQPHSFFTILGKWVIRSFSQVFPFNIPAIYPQTTEPEMTLLKKSFSGQTYQQYRLDKQGNPISFMSSTPLKYKGKMVGVIVLEQKTSTLLGPALNAFFHLVGIGVIIFLFSVIVAIIHIATLSNRIVHLDNDVRSTFNQQGKINISHFTDHYQRSYHDELSDLRHHIFEMLEQLSAYERYLKQFPKTLRHELHNPLNRLSVSLSLLTKEVEHKQIGFAQHALEQLKQIIASLTEANSIEDSLSQQPPEPFPIGIMLNHYIENITSLNPKCQIQFNNLINDTTLILGDGFMIEQMLDKLISNAKDFNDGKMPIKIEASLAPNHQVQLSILNSGPLLPKGYEKRIFDGMTSIRTLNEDDKTHLGLGLYIVKLIVEYHQGQIIAQNREDLIKNSVHKPITGVEFKITLPIYKA